MTKPKDLIKYFKFSPALLPLLNISAVSIVIILFLSEGLLEWKRKNITSIKKEEIKVVLLQSLPIILYLISLMWATNSNIDEGLSFVNRSYAFIIFPLIVFIPKLFESPFQIQLFIKVYVVSSGILSLIILGYLLMIASPEEFSFNISNYILEQQPRKRIGEIPFFNEHPIYISLILGTGIILLFFNRFKSNRLNMPLFLIMFFVVFIVSSRGPMIALILVACGVIVSSFKNKIKATLLLFLFLFIVGIGGYNSPLKSRFYEMISTKHIYPQGDYYNSFNLRMGIYKCGYEIAKNTPWHGYGAGEIQNKLNECYENNYDTNAYKLGIYNTHNQYLFYWISFGPIGFILLIGSYIIFINQAIKKKDKMYLCFLCFFFLCFLTENVLSRNTGIVLFCMFNSILYYNTILKNDSN